MIPFRASVSLILVSFVSASAWSADRCDFQSCYKVPMNEIADKARSGDCSCQLYEAKGYAIRGEKNPYDLTLIHEQLKAAAKEGDLFAIRSLGDFEYYGLRGPKNGPAAIKFYERAALTGDEDAEQTLGNLYQSGAPGIRPDFELAKKWLSRAAAPSNGGYMSMLAQRLSRGELGRPDKIEAYAWVILAEKFTGDGTPNAYSDFYTELRATLSQDDLKSAEKRAAELEGEYFQGATPKQKLSAEALEQRNERVNEIAERLKGKDGAELDKEVDALLKEYRGK